MSIVNRVRQLSNLNNLTAEDIGDKLNCSWRTVITIAQEEGIEIDTKYNRSKPHKDYRINYDKWRKNVRKTRWPQFYGDSGEQ